MKSSIIAGFVLYTLAPCENNETKPSEAATANTTDGTGKKESAASFL